MERGANVNLEDKRGYNAFIYAIETGNKNVLELILPKISSINSKNRYGKTPLIYSVEYGSLSITQLLIATYCFWITTDRVQSSMLF
ncbi:ankyrin repeat protein [Leptospira noguchii str. Cascata]|nr:ankyrin repeat protein [Leptospira noguchii str. Cascata]